MPFSLICFASFVVDSLIKGVLYWIISKMYYLIMTYTITSFFLLKKKY